MEVKKTYFTVTVDQISNDATSATIQWSWKRNKGHFGLCNSGDALVIKGANGYIKHLGIPKKGDWKSEWGSISAKLTDGKSHDLGIGWGSLLGTCSNGGSYTETVYLNRGNQRSISQDITVGIDSNSGNQKKWANVVTFKVSTAEINKPENISGIYVDVDGVMNDTRYIHLALSYTNYDQYYTATIYDTSTGAVVATENVTGRPGYVGTDIPITRDMFNQRKIYRCIIRGKDGIEYYNGTTDIIDIQPSGLAIYHKESGNAREIESVYFKNVNSKQAQKVYTKLNGRIIEIRK